MWFNNVGLMVWMHIGTDVWDGYLHEHDMKKQRRGIGFVIHYLSGFDVIFIYF
jgi:hypothetical protein